MNKKKDPRLTVDEAVAAENEVLKLKLKLEHGMEGMESDNLPPEVENQWLKSICAFEEQYKNAKRTTVHEFLGRPSFRSLDTLKSEELSHELARIRNIMSTHNVELDVIAEYDDATIYQFITEELFLHEMDDMRVPGMVTHFIYEEFHPNHDYDLRRNSESFVTTILSRAWNREYDEGKLADRVGYSGKEFERSHISDIIITFQETQGHFDVEQFDIEEVIVDTEAGLAQVKAQLSAVSQDHTGEHLTGPCDFHFVYKHAWWHIDAFQMPGM